MQGLLVRFLVVPGKQLGHRLILEPLLTFLVVGVDPVAVGHQKLNHLKVVKLTGLRINISFLRQHLKTYCCLCQADQVGLR